MWIDRGFPHLELGDLHNHGRMEVFFDVGEDGEPYALIAFDVGALQANLLLPIAEVRELAERMLQEVQRYEQAQVQYSKSGDRDSIELRPNGNGGAIPDAGCRCEGTPARDHS